MRTIWVPGLGGPPPRVQLGQWGEIISGVISAGTQYAIAREARIAAEKARKRAEEQTAALKASQDAAEAKRAEDARKAIEAQQAGIVPGAVPGASSQILGVDSTTFYVGAGILAVGGIIVTLLATR